VFIFTLKFAWTSCRGAFALVLDSCEKGCLCCLPFMQASQTSVESKMGGKYATMSLFYIASNVYMLRWSNRSCHSLLITLLAWVVDAKSSYTLFLLTPLVTISFLLFVMTTSFLSKCTYRFQSTMALQITGSR